MTKAVALVLLALCAAVSAIQFADEFEPHAQRQAFATNDRVDAMRSAAMRDDAERVSRLDTDTYGGHTVVHSHHALPLHLRRGHGKAVQIRRFNAEKQKFDLRRAEGVWYQIAVNRDFYNRYEKSCSCPVALVRVNSDTESMIQYTCVNKTGDLTIVRGTKRMESPGKFATTLKEKLIGEKVIRADDDKKLKETVHDEILALDDDMQWKIMENAKDKGIFIYSRKPTIDSRLFHDMISFIQKHTEGKLSAKDMKLFKHEETCSKLRSVIREFSGKYDEKGKGKIEETQRKHSPHRHFQDASSGAEPRTAKAGEQPKQKLDLSMLKGQWYEIARSRAASQSTEHGCACGLAFFDVTENAFNSQYACLNTTAKEDDSKVATASGHAVMDPNQEGVFRAKMLSKVPGKLSDDESKERKLILLALGDNFAATLEPDRKVVHIVARNTTMEKDLVGALAEMLQSIGIDPKDLDKVDQASGTCSTFHEKAKSKFGAKAKSSEHGLDTKKGLQQTGAADTSDAKVSGSSTLHDDKGEDKSKLLGKEGAGDDREHSQQRSFLDADEGVENRRIVMEILPSSVNAQGLRSTEVQPLQRVDLIPANFAVDDEGVENRRIVMEILPSSVSAQPLRSTEVQPLSRVELVPVTSFAADDEGVENRRIVMELAPSYTGSQAQPLRSGEVQPLMNIETAAPTQQRAAAAAAPAPDDTTPPPLDATILGGNWFDIAVSQDAYGMYHSGCECMQRYIQALDSNKLHVVGGCMNKTDSQLVTCVGGGVQDPASPGLFRLQELDKQPYGLTATEKAIHEVVVLAVGKDFAVLAEPAINSAWILSRAPTMAADLYDRLINLLVKIGFAKDSFRKFNQALPECQAVTNQMQAIGKQAAEKPNAPAAPTAAAPAPAAPAAAAPTASAAPAAPIAPAASAAPPIAPRSRLPQRPALIGEQPLASGEQQQYAEQQNPAYYGGDYYATEQPLAGDDQYYGDQ